MWSLGSWWREAGTDFLPQPLSVQCCGPVSPSPENTVCGLSQRVPSFQMFYFYCQINLHLTYPQRKVFVTGNICFVLLAVSKSPLLNYIQKWASSKSSLQASSWEWTFRATSARGTVTTPIHSGSSLPFSQLQGHYLQEDKHKEAKDI